ncbi:hypothetical protein HHK36_001178 [Tetracentron sinense]|uniref:RING-type E3 ubiquitin transferase n=1 Tax=Tetracentron sinense TaxID=13715 RepID=A0A834ZVJ6_TETSI|nr:hypothetical protein HHK36_001178 [Tetracentron sinense]
MGGCCCCSSRRAQLNGTPVYYYCPRALEEHEPVSARHGASSTLSTGLLVDTNLETSIPDTYRPPPAPVPYDVVLGHPQTPPGTQERQGRKSDAAAGTTDSDSVRETISGRNFETVATYEGLKESDCKSQTDFVLASPKESEVELSKSSEPIVSSTEDDVCPTCLEEYDSENPKIITKCEHHFHLSCILEWMERSDTCPVCDQEMIFNHNNG